MAKKRQFLGRMRRRFLRFLGFKVWRLGFWVVRDKTEERLKIQADFVYCFSAISDSLLRFQHSVSISHVEASLIST